MGEPYKTMDSNILEFCNEVINLLENHINSKGELLLLRDFNTAINKPFDAELATFLDILASFNVINRLVKPTHRLSNTHWPYHPWCRLKHHSQNKGGQALLWPEYCTLWQCHTQHYYLLKSESIQELQWHESPCLYKGCLEISSWQTSWTISMTRKTTTTQHLRQYWKTMYLSKFENTQVTPKSPALPVTSLKPSDTEGIPRGTGTKTCLT